MLRSTLVLEEYFYIYTGLNGNGSDLFNNFRWGFKVDKTFVDSHFESIPGIGTFTTWRFSGGQAKHLCWETYWTVNHEVLFGSTTFQISANLFKVLHVATGQRDSDSADWGVPTVKLFTFFHF
mmetsp:Transcript_16715/g.18936  ORF Transcript_16715/g.18936 Transcript_16715/m.18936 type:complete len:123 (+) Transcript_16715:796-1164(+)